ncbi:MAG: RsmB/NOP family class I SAM-dependent RNA methyltransferase [Zhengella sp.]|uniref:RsmB/NOP family class I SAM-dependent RNA methyltransferase n=1 Tax=Zhengella sp. TaxID=2282762 RepID=UPI001DCF9EED|nr:RsmB/NOP family class I SAM-dependent RNA methyltransferase [Notoacmeibacter sp.]MCC0026086.1 RsmB/NOP family class I SAM-dependent RNA methyltransferase [Brucellaceae bacterium]
MRLGGRLAAAIEILEDMNARRRPAADALRDWGVSHRFAGSGDRSAIGNIVYDALRWRASSRWRFGAETARAEAFGALASGFGMALATINAELEGDRFAPDPLSGDEQSAWEARPLVSAPEHVQAECPDWCAPLLAEAFGADWIAQTRALAGRPPLDLRVNTLKASPEKVARALAKADAAPFGGLEGALRIPPVEGHGRHPNITAEPAFQKGWFEVQDCGSQIVAALAAPDTPGQVFDLCAGGGGKTLALAASQGNRGQVHAWDSDKARLAPIFDRLRRAGTRNVQVHAADADLSPLEGQMDLVLVDAPCTGSGTWRRRPDTKWRLTETSLESRTGEQAGVLDHATRFVRPGGRIAYVTCSLFPQENTHQVRAFLERHPQYAARDAMAVADRRLPALAPAMRPDGHGGLLLAPALTGTDGFFLALFERRG